MRILVVDDSRFIRKLIQQTLELGHYGALDVKYAGDAEEALLFLRDFVPDVMIVDLNLPGMSGVEFIETVKRSGSTAKFGFISSMDETELGRQAEAAGASFFVAKPFSRDGVMEALQKVLP